jgi:two-component system, sensor histidine kinase and response regulator
VEPEPKARILLVDDHAENLLALEAILSGLGQPLVKAQSGREALRHLLDADFAVILLDVQMPEMDGFETARLIRQRDKSRLTPIIFLTAVGRSDEQVFRGYAVGAVDYLFKPFVLEVLRAKVAVFVDLFQKAAAVRRQAEQLAVANQALQVEIAARQQAEEEIKTLNEALMRRASELETVNKELEAFSYSVSHDLRAPLRSIDGFSAVLLEDYADVLDVQGQHYLQRVREASQDMGQLIDDLLNLSQVTRRDIRCTTFDISALAHAVAAELRETQPGRQVEFVIAPGLVVNADATLLRVVLANLLGNAWKFTGTQAQARIEFGVTQQEGHTVYVVRDNGVGFDMAYADKLFGAFQRLHRTTDFAGTGIGLATVQRIIHRHGGHVWAEGAVNQGATFYFTLSS